MSRAPAAVSIALLLSFATVTVGEHHGDEPGWLDCERCTICRPLSERPEILENMDWETHKIAAGMVMTTVIPESLQAGFEACCEKMKANAESLVGGEPLCGFCTAYGALLGSGVKEEMVETGFGSVAVITSDDPALVAEIHAFVDRSTAEMEKMLAAE